MKRNLCQQKILIIMKVFILLLAVLSCTQSGRILSGDVQVDYANAGSMTQLSFSFMLSNAITSTDYLLAALPFPFHSQLIPAFPATQGLSSPLGLLITYQLMDNSNNVLPTIYYTRVLTDTIDSSKYYIQFYAADHKTIVQIPANQWYYLTFKIQTTAPLAYQTSNSILQIQLSTVSSVWTNAIVYDDNLAFNYFQLAATPSQLITLAATPYNYGTSGGYLLIQKSYNMYLDVSLSIPSYYYNTNLILKFIISQQNTFTFSGTCSSVAKTNAPTIRALSASLYTCTVDAVNNLMIVQLTPGALAIQQSFRFSVGMINPATIAQGVSIIVNAVQDNCNIILGYGQATGVLSTNQLYVTSQQIYLAWGLRPDALLPFDARIFRGNSATPSYMPYNSLSLEFAISQSTSAAVELKVVINIPSETNAFVLPSGFSTNLPAFPNKQVVCVTQYASSGTDRRIGCTGVGALTGGTTYYVGWKMFFPYDNYQSAINCSQFGLLTIYTTTTITSSSFAYYLGRGDDFLDYLKSSANFVVIGRNSTYTNYMTTFPNVNLVVRSSDFQQFLSQPETLYINNRPPNYTNKTFNDVYVITQNLAFLTYMNLFTDIQCAVLIPQNTDIVNGYGSIPIVATTTPKNTLTITTSNSQDWTDYVTDTNPLVSSVTGSNTNTPGSSLIQNPSTPQSLVFSFKGLFSSVTSFSSTTGTVVTNGWGMMIMMSPSIAFDTATSPTISTKQPVSNSLSANVTSMTSATAYNKYTLVTMTGGIVDNFQNIFMTTATKTAFGLYPFRVNAFSSIYADANNQDIMIATIDGINGPQNRMTYNGYFLINGFTQAASSAGTLNMGFVNYQSSAAMDGSRVPTMLRIKGTVTNNQTAFDSLVVFFDTLTPFFSNKHSGQIYCYNSDNSVPCRYHQGPTSLTSGLNEKYNYLALSRFSITLNTPATAFNILIPVTFSGSQTATNFYVAYQVRNTTNSYKNLAYVEALRTISITQTASVSGSFGPVVGSVTVGQNVANLQLRATSPSTLTANSGNNIGAAFSYFSEWDYFGSSTVSGFNSYGKCFITSYLFYTTNYAAYISSGATFTYSYKIMKGLVCACDTSGAITGLYLTISTGYIPSKWGRSLPGFGAISQNTGNLLNLNSNYVTVGSILTTTGIVFPPVGPNMDRAVGQFAIPLPVALESNVLITMTGNSNNLPFTFTGTCAVYYNGAKAQAGCNFVTTPTTVSYTLTILQSGLIPAGTGFSIVHYGLTSNSSYNSVNVDINCHSLLTTSNPTSNQLIFSATSVTFPYNSGSYKGPSTLSLGSFSQWTNNKAVVESFSFTFTLINKGLYVTNRVRFNLGQFATDNAASAVNPSCQVYNYDNAGSTQYSHDFDAVDVSSGLTALELWPAYTLLSTNLTYTIKCINFLSTSSPTPISMSAMIANTSAGLAEVSTTTPISLPALGVASTTCQITLSKSFSIPSINMQMSFIVISPGITQDSYLYINFPYYYANGLGQDIKCYSPSGEIFCNVVDRFLTVQYMGIYAAGSSFTITVTGVTMPINYNSGTFSFIFDSDNDPTNILAAGTFVDTISSSVLSIQNFPTINIFAFSQSSAYLRQNNVQISLTFYLPTTLTSIGLGQSLFLVMPATYYDVQRFLSPTCTLNILGNTLKNYVSTCSIQGMRIKMPFLDNLVLGSTYTLTVAGIINPTNPTSNQYRYSIEITNTLGTSIIAKSYALNCNYVMPIFTANPSTTILNYYQSDNTLVTSVNTMANIMSSSIYIAPLPAVGVNIVDQVYTRNTYLSPLSSLLSNPSNINLLAGQNPYPIQLSALTSGVNFLYFTKTGDGSYYSNLPPLILTTSKNYFTSVSFVETGFKLPINAVGSEYNVMVTLSATLTPMSQVSFTVTLSTSVGVSLKTNPTVISFYPSNTIATIALFINDATQWIVGQTTNLVFTPTSNTTTYASGASLPLTAVAAPGAPVTTFTFQSATLNSLTFNTMCSEEGIFVYHLSRSFSYNSTACFLNVTQIASWLSQSALTSLRVSESYYQCNDVIGAVNMAANVAKTLNLGKLQSSTAYQIDGYCQTQGKVQTNLTTIVQSTNSNGGLVSTLNFYFSSALTTAQKIKLVCALALYFGIDYTKVSTWDGYYCSELLNRRRLLHEEPQKQNRLLVAPTYIVPVFIGINTNTNSDTSQAVVSAAANSTNLLNMLNNNVTGLPTLISTGTNAASYAGTNDISGNPSVGVGPNFAYVTNLALTHSGLVYIIVGDNKVWTRAPVVSEIKMGSGPNGLPPVYYKVLYYVAGNATSANLAWTALPNGQYTLYMVASDANPFDNANFGVIRSVSIVPEVASWQKILLMGLCALLLVLV